MSCPIGCHACHAQAVRGPARPILMCDACERLEHARASATPFYPSPHAEPIVCTHLIVVYPGDEFGSMIAGVQHTYRRLPNRPDQYFPSWAYHVEHTGMRVLGHVKAERMKPYSFSVEAEWFRQRGFRPGRRAAKIRCAT